MQATQRAEVTVAGYTTKYDPAKSIEVKADATASITIENTPNLGCLELTKKWIFPEGFAAMFPNLVYETSIDVKKTGPAGYSATWTAEAPARTATVVVRDRTVTVRQSL